MFVILKNLTIEGNHTGRICSRQTRSLSLSVTKIKKINLPNVKPVRKVKLMAVRGEDTARHLIAEDEIYS